MRHGGRWRRHGSDPWGPTIQYNVGEGGGDVVAILGDLQYNTIRHGERWRRRGSDPWGPTIQYDMGEGGGDVVAILGDLQYNKTWGKVEETW